MSVTFVANAGAWIVDPGNEIVVLKALLAERQDTLSGVLMASFNAPLLILRTLHAYLFTRLRKYHFDEIPEWKKIQTALRS
ncbi:MAG: hypothetical protein EOR33_21190 [Mesorhizobium sp.]|nr:MAG: hypothetical protein EOR33_21190 [Mesorhizobium sp.]